MTSASPPVFVGRRRELAELQRDLAEACAGHGRLCFITGEAGIGKTRLAEELAAGADAAPARVLWGRSWEGGGVPGYWPWIQILRRLIDRRRERKANPEREIVRRLMGEMPGERASAPRRRAGGDPPPDAASESARFALFDAVAGVLRAAARTPLVLIFDDLHATDVSSLLLLEFVARELRDAAVLLVGTYREDDVEADPVRATVLARTARLAHCVGLGGWSDEDIHRFVEATWQQSPAPALTDAVHRLTEGNPLYVVETLRGLAARHPTALPHALSAGTPIAAGIRHSIRARLAGVDDSGRRLLAAAVGAIVALPSTVARWAFRHGLIRATLYDDLPPLERARLHHRIGAALVTLHTGDSVVRVAETAHHLLHGAAAGGAELALEYVVRAARDAAARMAYEAAAARYAEALELLPRVRPGDAAARAELLLALGTVQAHVAATAGRAAFRDAAAAARTARDPVLLGRAAIGFAERGVGVPNQEPDRDAVLLLEEARAALPPGDGALRVRLLARLAIDVAASEGPDRGDTLSAEALAMARRLDDPVARAHALSARYFVRWRWDETADRRELASELACVAATLGDPELELQGRTWLILELMRAGDAVRLNAQLARYRPLAERVHHPRYLWMEATYSAMRALWRADLAAAEAEVQRAHALAERVGDDTARFSPLVQRFALRREQGRLGELEAVTRLAAERTSSPAPRTFLALLFCDGGRPEEARRVFDDLGREDFADLRRARRIGVLPHLAEICAVLGDADRAALLYDLLLPLAEANVPYGASLCFGSGAHYLALLAEARGDLDLAIAHVDAALARNARMGGPAWLARTQIEGGRVLCRRGRSGDRARGVQLLAEGLAAARALGLRALVERAERIESDGDAVRSRARQAVGQDAPPASSNARVLAFPERARRMHVVAPSGSATARTGTFRREGEFWALGDGTALVRLKDSKGVRYLALLLASPGRELHVTELVALEHGAFPDSGLTAAAVRESDLHIDRLQDAEPLLDAKAQADYRRRLEELRDALDEATGFNDVERAARARAEIDLIGHELARGLGLGGRDRRAASLAERARINVSRAIAGSIKRISAHNAALGRYFATTIRTGAFCSFTPDPRFPVDWQLD